MQIDPATLSRRDGHFLMVSAIVPRPIALVTTMNNSGGTNAAPFSYFTVVSSLPLSLLICAGRRRGAAAKDTHQNIIDTKEFVVNVVVEEILAGVLIGGTDHPPGISEIEMAGLETAASVKVRSPRLTASPVNMECRLKQVVDIDGTAIIAGEVVWIHVRDDILMNPQEAGPAAGGPTFNVERLKPIARLGGDQYARLGEVFIPPSD